MTPEQPTPTAEQDPAGVEEVSPIGTESLVEEVSIDGMCGVY